MMASCTVAWWGSSEGSREECVCFDSSQGGRTHLLLKTVFLLFVKYNVQCTMQLRVASKQDIKYNFQLTVFVCQPTFVALML